MRIDWNRNIPQSTINIFDDDEPRGWKIIGTRDDFIGKVSNIDFFHFLNIKRNVNSGSDNFQPHNAGGNNMMNAMQSNSTSLSQEPSRGFNIPPVGQFGGNSSSGFGLSQPPLAEWRTPIRKKDGQGIVCGKDKKPSYLRMCPKVI